jgi:SNF2 family DNA or RNA helicase
VVNNWVREAERFTPDLPVMVHHGSDRDRGKAFEREAKRHAIVVSSYGLLHRDLELFQGISWAGVILDEAQNIKNPETRQSKAARSLSAEYRIALTGTPVENHVGDLWSIMEFLNTGLLGGKTSFKQRFHTPIQTRQDPEATELLKKMTGPFILRRLKTDKSIIADLPEKQEIKTWCTLTREQASLYQAVLRDMEEAIESSEGMQRRGLVLATILKLKQICNHPAHFLADGSPAEGRSGKLERLMEILEEIFEAGERALVFTQFAEMGELLKRHIEETFGRETAFLHGGVPKKKRDAMVERFQKSENAPPVFLLSLKAGGTGLNLTRANHVVHFDRWWNPAVENQATDRAFRIGQTRGVQVRKFICTGTLEERIDEMINRKSAVSESVVGKGEAWITELSNEELKRALALGREALGE